MFNKKRCNIIFISVFSLLLVGILIFIICFLCVKPSVKNDLKYWENNNYSELSYGNRLNEFLPAFVEKNNYINANFYYHNGCINFDYAEAAYCLELILSYSKYKNSKTNELSSRNFLNEIPLEDGKLFLSDYKIGKFEIHFLEVKESKFPHEIKLIAFDDITKTVRYCYIISMSLDYFENETDLNNWIISNLGINW